MPGLSSCLPSLYDAGRPSASPASTITQTVRFADRLTGPAGDVKEGARRPADMGLDERVEALRLRPVVLEMVDRIMELGRPRKRGCSLRIASSASLGLVV